MNEIHKDERMFIHNALVELLRRIEACEASPALTNASGLCADLKMAIATADTNAIQRVNREIGQP